MPVKSDILDIFIQRSPHLSWLKTNTIFLTVHGSIAYGLNTPESDIDVRGVCIPTKEYFLGFNKRFEQAELKDPDATIFDIRKFFNLASQGNPNTVELLFVEPEDHILVNDLGKILLDNRDKFLSRNLKERYIGYAKAQAHRIKNHKRWIDSAPKPPPSREEFGLRKGLSISEHQMLAVNAILAKKLEQWNCDFEPFSEPQKIYLKGKVSDILSEMHILSDNKWELAARNMGASENFIHLLHKEKAYQNLVSDYSNFQTWKKTRNPKRAALEEKIGYDAKHATMLVRLLKVGKEVLLTAKMQVKRTHDREELMEIKNCQWPYEKLIEYADKIEGEVKEAYFKSPLPLQTDIQYLDRLCISLIEYQNDIEGLT